MKIQTITVSAKNQHTGKFLVQLQTVQDILAGKTNALIIVDEAFKEDVLQYGTLLKGADLWKTIGTAISNGFLRSDYGDIFFVADRP